MQIISHRINTIKDLKNVDHSYGIEVDICAKLFFLKYFFCFLKKRR